MKKVCGMLLLCLYTSAQAQQIIPPRDLYCGADAGAQLMTLRLSLLEGKAVRKYRDVDVKTIQLGPNTVTFARVTVATTINGMRFETCDVKIPGLISELPTGQRWDTRSYALPVGAVPTVVMELVPKDGGGGWLVIRGKGAL